MIDDEDEDHVPHKDIPESQDDEFARSVSVRDAARRAFIFVDTDQRLRRVAVSASRPDRLTFQAGDMCYFWRDGVGWSPGMATVVSQVGQGHYYVDYGGRIFQQSAEQIVKRSSSSVSGSRFSVSNSCLDAARTTIRAKKNCH